MAKFDPTQPHGTIYGDPDGRRYEQNGAFFQENGAPWSPAAPRAPAASPGPIQETAEFRAAVDAAVADAVKRIAADSVEKPKPETAKASTAKNMGG